MELNWQISSDEIKETTAKIIQETTSRCDQIAAAKDMNDERVIAPFNEMERLFKREICFLNLLSKTSANKIIRDSCNDAVAQLNKFAIEIKYGCYLWAKQKLLFLIIRMRKDLFDVLQKFSEVNKEPLDKETKRYLDRSITEGKQDGLKKF